MLYTYPDYYKEFKCIADRCEATCCAGWQIVVDEESLARYKKYVDKDANENSEASSLRLQFNSFRERLKQSIDWQDEVFKQDECRRCAFLNERNLCDMYTALGEESLCHTCTSYPRHTEEFEDVREVTLSLSCPEVARIVMEKQDKATFYDIEKKDEAEVYEDYEEFDVLMFGILHDARNAMIDIMQDRTMDISLRTSLVWSMACDMQDSIDEGTIFACEDIVEVYKQLIGDAHKAKDTLQQLNRSYDTCQPQERYEKALDMFKYLYQLEVLNEDWERDVDETSLNLFGVDSNHYENISQEFKLWLDDNKPNWQIQCEQIVVYFLATYLCGAVYDGRVAAKAKMAVASVFYIYEMLLSKWIKQGRELSEHDIIEMVYRYSRELEHSDINLDELEYCFDGYFDSDDID